MSSNPWQQGFQIREASNLSESNAAEPTTVTSKDENQDFISQPETRPISQEQLGAEVKGIYAGLVMVEAKCLEVDSKHATLAQIDPTSLPKFNDEQWQAMIALHRTLLHEHHDFSLASQHPSASPTLRNLAAKYAMPARMWRHGIHSFLELLRHRLPASKDHLLDFIYIAYSMMALLYETVPAFADTWIECLGDLARYRMAIEDADIKDREIWMDVSKHWYSLASDKAPTTGRLYHHLAILVKPDILKQLYYYDKSLCVAIPFDLAHESILTVFDLVLTATSRQVSPLDTAIVKAQGLLFKEKDMDNFEPIVTHLTGLLNGHIIRLSTKFLVSGYQIAIANCCAILGWGSKDHVLMRAMFSESADTEMSDTWPKEPLAITFRNARLLHHRTAATVFARNNDPNILSFVHAELVFLCRASRRLAVMDLIQDEYPWETLVVILNTLLLGQGIIHLDGATFPTPDEGDRRPLPEDYALRGLLWEDFFPKQWFDNQGIDDEEKEKDRPSMYTQRKDRILWHALRLEKAGPWIKLDREKGHFFKAARPHGMHKVMEQG